MANHWFARWCFPTDRFQDSALREERLYFFQFPSPFPTYLSGLVDPSAISVDVEVPDVAAAKRVTFASDVKPPSLTPGSSRTTPSMVTSDPAKPEALDGIIGQLEVYRSGAVKIRLDNGILLDVLLIFIASAYLLIFISGQFGYPALLPPTGCFSKQERKAAQCAR